MASIRAHNYIKIGIAKDAVSSHVVVGTNVLYIQASPPSGEVITYGKTTYLPVVRGLRTEHD